MSPPMGVNSYVNVQQRRVENEEQRPRPRRYRSETDFYFDSKSSLATAFKFVTLHLGLVLL